MKDECGARAVARNSDVDDRSDSANKMRQGEIILKTRSRRLIFIAGLVGFVVLAFIVGFTRHF